jgi:murein DD-endopeptidase MepM/ murein hydrolase activator NlpD
MSKPRRSISDRLADKYRLIIYNDNTFEEVGSLKLKGFNLLWIFGALAFILVTLTFILIAYTSIREFIPGYPSSKEKREIVMNAIKLDSLEHEIKLRDAYFANMQNILLGKDTFKTGDKKDSIKIKNIKFTKSKSDSLLRKTVEEEQLNVFSNDAKGGLGSTSTYQLHFFTPLKGVITNKFNPMNGHYGLDIVAGPNEVIKSVLDGTVILATWTLETGYVIQIQHSNNLVSVYKHNAELLKSVGTHVSAGEPIAIVGNSGEITTGPHLHFELWYNGQPVNPEDYIVF